MEETNTPVGTTTPPRKSRKKWLIGGLIASLLIAATVFGATSNFFGALDLNFDEVELEIEFATATTDVTALYAKVCAEAVDTSANLRTALNYTGPGEKDSLEVQDLATGDDETALGTAGDSDKNTDDTGKSVEDAAGMEMPDLEIEDEEAQTREVTPVDDGTEDGAESPKLVDPTVDEGTEETEEITGAIEATLHFIIGDDEEEDKQAIKIELGTCEEFFSKDLADWGTEFEAGKTYSATAVVKYDNKIKDEEAFRFTMPGENVDSTPSAGDDDDSAAGGDNDDSGNTAVGDDDDDDSTTGDDDDDSATGDDDDDDDSATGDDDDDSADDPINDGTGASDDVDNDFIRKATYILMRIGNLEEFDEDAVNTIYGGFLVADNPDELKVDFITKLLFEDGGETYTELIEEIDEGIYWENEIYNHWDGIIFRVYPTDWDTDTDQTFHLKVNGLLDKEIKSVDDLTVYPLNDGTGNAVELSIFGEPGDAADLESIDNIKDIADALNQSLGDVEETEDPDVGEDVNDLVESILDPRLTESDEAADILIDAIKSTPAADDGVDITESVVAEITEDIEDAVVEAEEEVETEEEVSFTDVSKSDWFADYVDELAEEGILSGYDDGTFRPEQEITRAELTKVAVVAFELPIIDEDAGFSDVSEDDWFAPYINTAAYYGFINGYDDGTFKPNDTINRAETAKVLVGTIAKMLTDPEYFLGSAATWTNPFVDVYTTAWYYEYFMQGYTAGAITGSLNEDGYTYGNPGGNTTRGAAAKIVQILREILATPTI